MTATTDAAIDIPGVIHAERTPPEALLASGGVGAPETYGFEEIYGQFCPVQGYIDCHHPNYDAKPSPEKAPAGRDVWVGDYWALFPAGHILELNNLTAILEHRHRNGLPIEGQPR